MAGVTCPLATDGDGVSDYRAIVSKLVSIYNHNHGQGFTAEYFFDKIQGSSKIPFKGEHDERFRFVATMLYLAGMMGADGKVGCGLYAADTALSQSCEPYCLAYARSTFTAHGWGERDAVSPSESQESHDRNRSGNTRRSFQTKFKVPEIEEMCFTFGALDHCRSMQWLVTLITRIVFHCRDEHVPNRMRLLQFLRLILIVIRKWVPSPGRWVTVVVLEKEVDAFLRESAGP